jgi:(R,R)-butanediol dehydrogenase/meso-butanediol dehydrogenase/diacetyl reductase
MRALRWHDRGDVRLEEVPEPETTDELGALIEVSRCGICGSDLAEVRHGPVLIRSSAHPISGQAPPITLGHELVGTLRSGSSPDGRIEPGMRVTVDACLRCGRCEACARGDYHRCRLGGSIGLHTDGGFAPLVAVPGYTLVAVPDEVSDEQAALTEPFAVGLHALERAGVAAARTVLVLGFGPIGAACAMLAGTLGAQPFVVEVNPERRATAERLGVATIDAGDDLPRRVRRAVGGGGADIVVESTGVAGLLATAIECATRGGRIALAGLPRDEATIDPKRITLFERSLVGSLGYRHDLPRVIDLVAAGRVDPAEIVGAVVSLSEAKETMISMASSPSSTIKVLIDPKSEGGARNGNA